MSDESDKAEEIRILRYCYEVLRRRTTNLVDGLSYWQMNLRVVTYLLRQYDDEFDPTSGHYNQELVDDEELLDDEKKNILRSHALLQRSTVDESSETRLTEELELEMKRRIAKYFDSRT